jgi:hypothetical protein
MHFKRFFRWRRRGDRSDVGRGRGLWFLALGIVIVLRYAYCRSSDHAQSMVWNNTCDRSSGILFQRGATVRRSSQQLRAFLSASSLGIVPKSMELPSRVACPLILQMNLGFSGIWLGARFWNSYETWFLHHLQESSSKNKSQGCNNPIWGQIVLGHGTESRADCSRSSLGEHYVSACSWIVPNFFWAFYLELPEFGIWTACLIRLITLFLLSRFCRYSFTIWVEVLDIPTIIPYFPSVCRTCRDLCCDYIGKSCRPFLRAVLNMFSSFVLTYVAQVLLQQIWNHRSHVFFLKEFLFHLHSYVKFRQQLFEYVGC